MGVFLAFLLFCLIVVEVTMAIFQPMARLGRPYRGKSQEEIKATLDDKPLTLGALVVGCGCSLIAEIGLLLGRLFFIIAALVTGTGIAWLTMVAGALTIVGIIGGILVAVASKASSPDVPDKEIHPLVDWISKAMSYAVIAWLVYLFLVAIHIL